MAQTGDVALGNSSKDFDLRRVGMGGSDLPDLKQEFNDVPHERGTFLWHDHQIQIVLIVNFLFVLNKLFLDRQYTVFGKVIEGMEFVDMIKKGDEITICI